MKQIPPMPGHLPVSLLQDEVLERLYNIDVSTNRKATEIAGSLTEFAEVRKLMFLITAYGQAHEHAPR